jgi:hypothetical protein
MSQTQDDHENREGPMSSMKSSEERQSQTRRSPCADWLEGALRFDDRIPVNPCEGTVLLQRRPR